MAANEMWGTARLQIKPGKAEEVKALVARATEVVKEKDPGTIEYSIFINDDETELFVHERYAIPEDGMAHSENIGSLMAEFQAVADLSGEVCGEPSPELRKMLEDAGVTIYTPLSSL